MKAKNGSAKKENAVGKGLVGKESGLSKRAFYIATLKENEKVKRSDAELQKMFDAEFPGTVAYPVKGIRASLNRGSFGDRCFTSKAYGEPAKEKKATATIGISEVALDSAPPAKKVRLRRGKEA